MIRCLVRIVLLLVISTILSFSNGQVSAQGGNQIFAPFILSTSNIQAIFGDADAVEPVDCILFVRCRGKVIFYDFTMSRCPLFDSSRLQWNAGEIWIRLEYLIVREGFEGNDYYYFVLDRDFMSDYDPRSWDPINYRGWLFCNLTTE